MSTTTKGSQPQSPRRLDEDADALSSILADWNFASLRPLQRESIEARIAGRDQLCVMGTGCGKTLCFQAPALRARALTLVITPLISLMKDQVDRINAQRPRAPLFPLDAKLAACINCETHPTDEQIFMTLAEQGQLPLLYISPERFVSPRFFTWLSGRVKLATIVVDEAHCVTEWGESHGSEGAPPFRKAYKELGVHIAALRKTKPGIVVSAFTATATPAAREEIAASLGLRNAAVFVGDFDRPNLSYRVNDREDIDQQLIDFVRTAYRSPSRPHCGIIYAITRAETERIAHMLQDRKGEHGLRAAPYHAGMTADERDSVQDCFMAGLLDVIVATIAFGMGIDKPDVRFVLHAGMPSSLEVYHQEVGRAGRDGKPAECVLFYGAEDACTWDDILTNGSGLENDDPRSERLWSMDQFCWLASEPKDDSLVTTEGCRREYLLEYFGQEHRGRCGNCDVCMAVL